MKNRHYTHNFRGIQARFGAWTEVPRGLLLCAHEKGIEGEWQDVIGMIREHEGRDGEVGSVHHRLLKGKPV